MTTTVLHTAGAIRNASSLAAAKEMVKHNMQEADSTVIRSLLMVYANQTSDEQESEHTKYDNKVGFSGVDSQILTSFAKQVQRFYASKNRTYGSPLSEKQMRLCRRLMMRYAGQVARILRSQKPASV